MAGVRHRQIKTGLSSKGGKARIYPGREKSAGSRRGKTRIYPRKERRAGSRRGKGMEQNMNKGYDLFLFAGQSNMAGRGITSERFPGKAPAVLKGAGVEFRAVSDPGRL